MFAFALLLAFAVHCSCIALIFLCCTKDEIWSKISCHFCDCSAQCHGGCIRSTGVEAEGAVAGPFPHGDDLDMMARLCTMSVLSCASFNPELCWDKLEHELDDDCSGGGESPEHLCSPSTVAPPHHQHLHHLQNHLPPVTLFRAVNAELTGDVKERAGMR